MSPRDEPTPHDEALAGAAEQPTDDKVHQLDQALTKRINDVRTDFASLENEVSDKVQHIESELRTLKTQASNNAESIRSFQSSIDELKKNLSALGKQIAQAQHDLTTATETQTRVNEWFQREIEASKNAATEATQTSHRELLEQVGAVNTRIAETEQRLSDRIQQVTDAPVKPHTHSIHVDGTTGGVVVPGKGATT